MRLLPRLAALLCCVPALVPAADGTGWRAGFAAARITPSAPLMLAGYAGRTQPAREVDDELHLKVMALEDASGARALLVTADLIGFRADFTATVIPRITAATGIPRARILLNASHTHAGPAIMLGTQSHYTIARDQAEQLVAYTVKLQNECVRLAGVALTRLATVRLRTGTGQVNFPMNRREHTDRGVILGVNPRGPVDRSVPVLRVDDAEGRLVGVLFGAACHNTTYGTRDNRVSGDYAGVAQAFLERAHPGVQAMFLQGLAGDANPYPNSLNDPAKRSATEIARAHGAELGREVDRVLGVTLRPVAGPLRTAHQEVALPLQPPPARAALEQTAAKGAGTDKWIAGEMLRWLSEGRSLPLEYRAPVSVWQFAEDLTLVALPGEVVVDYVALLEEALGHRRLWLSAYCDDTFGYLPSARVLREGGYETRGLYHGGIGRFAPTVQEALVQSVRELAAAAGRR